jgi:flagellar biosynthesis protein FliQ
MALCLYAYGTAYVAVPLFLLCAIPVLIRERKITLKGLIPGLIVLVVLSAPIGLYLLVNARHWESLHLGLITIPQIPGRPRYEAVSVLFKGNLLGNVVQKFGDLSKLLWVQVDGHIYNAFDPYGYFYKYTLPFAILGAVLLIPFRKPENLSERLLLLAWLLTGLILGILQQVNINRINLVFIPLILCVAYLLAWVAEHSRLGLIAALTVFLVAFGFFTYAYHSQEYRSAVGGDFFTELLPAINFASQQKDTAICITDKVNEPYIYVLFSQKPNPSDYLKNIVYSNPHAKSGQVLQLDRYSFGLDNCPQDPKTIYVLSDETPPQTQVAYDIYNFDRFKVYIPSIASK